MTASRIRACVVRPLRASLISPFRIAGGQHDSLENVLLRLELADGTKGFGEAAIAAHITGETVGQTLKNLESAGEYLSGKDAAAYPDLAAVFRGKLSGNMAAAAAIEMALLDALTRQLRAPLWKIFGRKPSRCATDITIVIAGLAETEEAARKFYARGFRAFKIKIGGDMDFDFKRVAAVKKIVGNSAIYLDANQGYSARQTLLFVKMLKRARIRPSLLEQPAAKEDWEGLKKVSRCAGIPVCADESVRTPAEALRAIREKAVSVINIKLMKSGLLQAAEIARMAQAAGIELMIGSMMESALAATAAAHLAAGLGAFRYVDLDTPFFIKGRAGRNPYLNSRGIYDVSRVRAGIGIIP